MKKNNRFLKAVAGIVMGLAMSANVAHGEDLVTFLDSVSSVLPNKLSLGLRSEIRYDDNINSVPRGEKRGSFIFNNSVYADLHRQIESKGAYGLRGSLGYDYYTTQSSDKNDVVWSLFPYVNGSFGGDGMLHWRISMNSTAKRERMSSGDTRYALHYTLGVNLSADYQYHPRWGIIGMTGWNTDQYPQSEFRSYSKNTFTTSLAPYYRLTDKSRVGVKVTMTNTIYRNHDTNDDSTRMAYRAFWDWRASELFTSTIEAGVERAYYSGKTKDVSGSSDYKPSGMVTLRYLPYRNLGFIWNSWAFTKDSTLARTLLACHRHALTANWTISTKLSFSQSVGITFEEAQTGNSDTREWFLRSLLNYKVTDHVNCYAGYEYINVTYPEVHPNDYHDNMVKIGATWHM